MFKFRLPLALTKVTSFSKFLALVLLIILPFLGFRVGIEYQKSLDTPTLEALRAQLVSSRDLINNKSVSLSTPQISGTVETYTSAKLGISFKYFLEKDSKYPVKVQELGNRVYIYVNYSPTAPDDPTKGKYIEVFSKPENQSLSDSIKNLIFENKTNYYENCSISDFAKDKKYTESNPSFIFARIYSSTLNSADTYAEAQRKASLCPVGYTFGPDTGEVYFLMDKNHPGKFAFISTGQDNFNAENGLTWDMTLKFLD